MGSLVRNVQQIYLRSGICRATEWGGSITGIIMVGWSDGRAASEHQIAILESLCDSIGHALGQEQLLMDIHEKNRMLQAEARARRIRKIPLQRSNLVRSITSEIRDTLNPYQIVESTGQRLREALGADNAHILTLEGDALEPGDFIFGRNVKPTRARARQVVDMAVSELGREVFHVRDASFADVFANRMRACAASGATLRVADLREAQAWAGEEPRGPGRLAEERVVRKVDELGIRSGLFKATSAGGRVNGLVAVLWLEPGRACRLCHEDIALFEDVCQAVGIALGQARLVQQAQQAARAKSDFLSVVTHELRTPMQAVTAQKSIALQLALERDFPRFIVSDRGRLRQARNWWSSISSAVRPGPLTRAPSSPRLRLHRHRRFSADSAKFADEGRIVVEVEAEGCPGPDGRHLFRISVTDTGCGIPADQQRRLFEFFGQLDTSKARRHPGTGLGLYISQGIARALDGEIAVASTPGTGSTFAVTFRAAVLSPADAVERGLALLDLVERAVAELARMRTRADVDPGRGGAPPALLLLRVALQIDPPYVRPHVVSLRMPVAEAVLHENLAEAVRARSGDSRSGAEAEPQSPPPQSSSGSTAAGPARAPSAAAAAAGIAISIGEGRRRLAEGETGRQAAEHTAAKALAGGASPGPGAEVAFIPRILFAEDTPTNARIVVMQLRKLGYGDGRRALEAARAAAAAAAAAALGEGRGERPFDVLLSDIMMPEMDGLESLRRMRAELPPARVPYAIALSANVGAHDRRECAEAGYDAFLAKPVRAGELQAALSAAAQRLRPRPRGPDPDPDPKTSTSTAVSSDRES
eukprot:tig00020965_g16856.t1